jgi:O-antigen/teichoic acid export membrane protein
VGLKRNIVANYFSQAYVAGVGILTVPIYVHYLGTEAYGLIGFYTMLQAWFQLLDVGLSTTLSRESSRYNAGGIGVQTLARLRTVLERAFLGIAAFGVLIFCLGGDVITHRWLNVGTLSSDEVTRSVQLMGVVIAARWISCLYRGVVTGFERQVWLGNFNVGVATARFVLCLPVIICLGATPTVYFSYHALVAIVEAWCLFRQANTLVPRQAGPTPLSTDLRAPLKFASGVAFTSVVWVLVTQADKLLLSKLLPLSVYGEFSLAVLLAGGINLLAAPIGMALLPRLTATSVAADEASLRTLYSKYTQITCLATFPAAFTLFACAGPVLHAWTGKAELAHSVGSVLGLYSLGNALMGLTAFGYYIQYAKGNIRLHLIGNAVFATAYLPAVLFAAKSWGATGAATAWLIMNAVYLLCWLPLIHRALIPGAHLQWMSRDVLPIALAAGLPTFVPALISSSLTGYGRWQGALLSIAFFICSLACGSLASGVTRSILLRRFQRSALV